MSLRQEGDSLVWRRTDLMRWMVVCWSIVVVSAVCLAAGMAPGFYAVALVVAVVLIATALRARIVVAPRGLAIYSPYRSRQPSWTDVLEARTRNSSPLVPLFLSLEVVTRGGRVAPDGLASWRLGRDAAHLEVTQVVKAINTLSRP